MLKFKKIFLVTTIAILAGCLAACNADNGKQNASKADTTAGPVEGGSSPMKNWKLVWNEEFDGKNGSPVDTGKWTAEIGNNSGWGNSELQYYTDSTANCVQQDGNLVIKALKERKDNFDYTSARIKTQGKFEFQYGKVEMRAKLPKGQGIWPAFWMLGNDIGSVRWPDCGEIDIMEHIGRQSDRIFGTLHGPQYSGSGGLQGSVAYKGDLYSQFHTYTVEWDEFSIVWYFDGQEYHKIVKDKLPGNWRWPFDKKFFILVNLAVGGQWPQNPDDTTEFPQTYMIDYIRVYQK